MHLVVMFAHICECMLYEEITCDMNFLARNQILVEIMNCCMLFIDNMALTKILCFDIYDGLALGVNPLILETDPFMQGGT